MGIEVSEAYSEPCQTSKMDVFAKIINGWKQLTIFMKNCLTFRISYFTQIETPEQSQSAMTCSRLTIKTLEQGMKYVQS